MKGRESFFGRQDLIAQLDELWAKRVPSLVTCRGRRRVGKSTLIEEFARRSDAAFIKLDGLRPKEGLTDDDERLFFAEKLRAQVKGKVEPPDNWYEAFMILSGLLPIGTALAFVMSIIGKIAEIGNGALLCAVLLTVALFHTAFCYVSTVIAYEDKEL